MRLKCEFDYCVYNKKSICILDEIQMNSLGMCDVCEMITVPKEKLEEYKIKRLKDIMNRYVDSD